MAHASDTGIEGMDGREAIYVDKQGITGGDFMYPESTYSTHAEKEQEKAKVVEVIDEKLKDRHYWSSHDNLERVPEPLRREKPKAYTPLMVSIGPFHHGQQHLQPMEARKIEYLDNFLHRKSSVKLENLVEAVIHLADRAYRCYPKVEIERKRFVMMMVVDGCFILELLIKLLEGTVINDESIAKLLDEYAFVDLILLENQLPFFVLEELYRVFVFDRAAGSYSLQSLVYVTLVRYITTLLFGKLRIIEEIPSLQDVKTRHLLDFVRQFLIPSSPLPFRLLPVKINADNKQQKVTNDEMKEQKAVGRATMRLLDCASPCVRWFCDGEEDNPLVDPTKEWNVQEPILCATELKNANVKFIEISKGPTNLSDIKFDNAKGVLTIPGIVVNDLTEIILRNLLAYEIYTYDYSYINEYLLFLKGLINSGKDVELLQESGILKVPENYPKDVAKLFNDMPKYVPSYKYFTRPICRELMKYSNISWHRWKASLMLNYFNTPWALISAVAATILLFLTVTQTIYAAVSYHY